jgi:hypothetical protein
LEIFDLPVTFSSEFRSKAEANKLKPETLTMTETQTYDFAITIASPFNGERDFTLSLARIGGFERRQKWVYDFRRAGDPVALFSGTDFSTPLGTSVEGATKGVMGFLTLRPGDTDAEYFEAYSDAQREWADSSECEHLAYEVSDMESTARETFGEAPFPYAIAEIG